jgi:hypothetical protein
MKKSTYLATTLFVVFTSTAFGQYTISDGKHVLEISGSFSSFLNLRNMKPNELDKNNDRFSLRDAQIQFEGRVGTRVEYDFQVDIADLISGGADPENPGLMDAWMKYKIPHWFDIQAGYGKVNYSRSSLVPFNYTAFWQRTEITRGNFFSRRDVGITLMKDFWKKKINAQFGVYNGLGETTLRTTNDASGKFEYVGRIEFCYPSPFRHRDIDDKHVPIPMFALGLNGRYANKVLPFGEFFPSGSAGDFGFKVFSGEKTTYGLDFAAQWMGFSAQFEIHQIKGTPSDTSSFLLRDLNQTQTKGYFLAGGYYGQLNYHSKKLHTIVSIRFDENNLSDLIPGFNQRFSGALAYQLDGFNSMIKMQFTHILKEESISEARWTDQVRIGWQYAF